VRRLLYANRKLPVPFARGGDAWDVHEWLLGLSHSVACTRIAIVPRGVDLEAVVGAFAAVGLLARPSTAAGRVAFEVADLAGRAYHLVLTVEADVLSVVREHLRSRQPDAVVTAQLGSDEVAQESLARGVRCFVVINHVEDARDRLARLADAGCTLIAGSRFLQEHYAELPTVLVQPAVDPERYRVRRPDVGCATMINPIPPKGGATFIRLSRQLPNVQFLAVEGWSDLSMMFARNRRHNLRWQAWHPDIRHAFRQTRVLLAPSVWPEAFCRSVVEAQVSGIPAIVSGRGGLPSTIGAGGIVVWDPEDLAGWCAATRRLWDDETQYAYLSRLAIENALRFRPETSVRALAAALEL